MKLLSETAPALAVIGLCCLLAEAPILGLPLLLAALVGAAIYP